MDTIESALGLTRAKLVRWLDRAEAKGFPRRGRDALLRLMASASVDLGELLAPFDPPAGARRLLASELASHALAAQSPPARAPAAAKLLAFAGLALLPACNEPISGDDTGSETASETDATSEGPTEPTTGGAGNELVVPEAVYCALSSRFDESFAELRQRRLKLRLAAGRFDLPQSSEYDEHKAELAVPFTLESSAGALAWPEGAGSGQVYVSRGYDLFDVAPGRMAMVYLHDLPAPAGAPALFGDSWEWTVQVTREAAEPVTFDVGAPDSASAQWERQLRISPVGDFGSCTLPEAGGTWRTSVTLADGEVVLEERRGASMVVQAPVQLVRAAGTFRGQEFAQDDYYELLYRPHGLDGSDPSFAFLFPAPIDGVCGLAFEHLGNDELPPLDSRAWTIDCDYAPVDPLEISATVTEYVEDP